MCQINLKAERLCSLIAQPFKFVKMPSADNSTNTKISISLVPVALTVSDFRYL